MNLKFARERVVKVVLRLFPLFFFVGSAQKMIAAFHLWEINELYSNTDGSVQFVEMFNPFNGEQFVQGHVLESRNSDGSLTNSFTFPSNTPSVTANRSLLLATAGFADLPGGIDPDYIIPENFLFVDGGVVDFLGATGRMEFPSLPTDGVMSFGPVGVNEQNSPENFSGDTGFLAGSGGDLSVTITSPEDSAAFSSPATIDIVAEVDGTAVSVEFFQDGTSVGSDDTAPFEARVELETGSYVLTATATDGEGGSATSPAVTITIEEPAGGEPIENPIEETIPQGDIIIELELVADGMTAPLGLAAPDDGTGRLFVYDQAGQIHIIENGQRLADPLLDVRDRLVSLGIAGPDSFDERGLLGLALHPDFPEDPRLYTYTSEPVDAAGDFTTLIPDDAEFDHQSVIAEWRIDPENANRVDPATRREIMRIDQPQFNHDGGTLRFGPDNFLFISLGDGGSGDDQGDGHGASGNAQNIENIYGTIVRIDVDGDNGANGQYGIPPENPFVSVDGLDEIFAYGLRNPFQFSFDRSTGDLWVGDVGQHQIEEINQVVAGGNYGWNIKEGSFFFDPNGDDPGFVTTEPVGGVPPDLIDPVAEYDHDDGIAVIGGFVYRGAAMPALEGRYVFGEFQFPDTGRLFYLDAGTAIREFRIGADDRALGMRLKGFGQDLSGELYVAGNEQVGPFGDSGKLFRLVPVDSDIAISSVVEVEGQPGMLRLEWQGGFGPFLVESTTDLMQWSDEMTTDLRETTIAIDGDDEYFRVVDQGP